MATDARVEALLAAFEQALGELSLSTVRGASRWWEQVDKGGDLVGRFADSLVAPWDEGAVLGVAFYRLLRALETGRTIESPVRFHAKGGPPTYGVLADEFYRASGVRVDVGALKDVRVGVDRIGAVDPLSFRTADIEKAKALFRARLASSDVEAMPGHVSGIAQQAAAGGARTMVEGLGEKDPDRRAWIRVSGSGRPCAFCAMLLSRGAVYTSKDAAPRHDKEHGNGTRGYHPNCHCYSLPLFAGATPHGSRFALNREMEDLWRNDFAGKGFNGKSGWRSYFYRKFKR